MSLEKTIKEYENQIRRKEKEIQAIQEHILKLKEQSLSIRCGWKRDGIYQMDASISNRSNHISRKAGGLNE